MKRFYLVIFWCAVFLLLFIYYGFSSGNFVYTFYFLVFFLPVIIATSYVFNDLLVSKYLVQKRYGRFALYTFYLFVISLDLEFLLVFLAFLVMSIYDFENMHLIIDQFKSMPLLMYMVVLLYSFVSVISGMQQQAGQVQAADYIMVRSDRKNRKVLLNKIRYIESMSDYIRIYLYEGEIIHTRETISAMEQQLGNSFLRIHRSFLVSKDAISAFNREVVTVKDQELPISRTYRKKVIEALHS